MTIIRIIAIAGLIIGIGALIWNIAPGKSRLSINQTESYFPTVSGYNLERKEFEFPRDFGGELNLVIVPFKQFQQTTVNTWIPTAQEIEASIPDFIYYELPTIYEMPVLSRTFINEGMRAGIPEETARQRTITLYLDKEKFKSALNIPDEETIYLFLVNREGEILWTTTGAYSSEKAEDLINFVEDFRNR